MMKRICLVLVFTLFAVGLASAQSSRLKNFYSKESKVGFKYPAKWKAVSEQNSTADEQGFKELVTVTIPERNYPGTNFVESYSRLAVASVPNSACKKIPPSGANLSRQRRVNFGKNMFYMVTGSEGAAGSIFETETYRTFHNGRCYQFDLVLHTGNMGSYDKGTVKEVNGKKVFANLEAIVRSLYF